MVNKDSQTKIVPISFSLPDDLLAEIEEAREAQHDIFRSATIHRLIRAGLKQAEGSR